MIKFSFKHPLYTKYHLPNGRKSQKTDFGHFAFGHVGTIKKFFQMGLNWFFRPKISLGTIKYTSGLYKKQTFVSKPTGLKWPFFKKVRRFGNLLTKQCILAKKCTLEMSRKRKNTYQVASLPDNLNLIESNWLVLTNKQLSRRHACGNWEIGGSQMGANRLFACQPIYMEDVFHSSSL